jgi:outer membrane protein TolC
VQIAQAALAQAEADAAHAVAYTYLAALYAREQQRVADEAVAKLKDLEKFASDFVEAGATTVTKRNVEQIRVYSLVAQSRREEAVQGVERALSGLREAMGVGPDCPIALAADGLPDVNPPVDRQQVIALAVARRGEVAQAATAVEVTCLEIDAQAANRHGRRVNTFAAGSDIHANVLPAGEHGTAAYKPGAVALEMPTLIAGSRDDRVEQARAYHARAQAVAEKARGLVALEAEQAYLHWLEAARKAPTARKAADDARRLSDALRKEYEPRNPRTRMEDLLNAGVVASQLRVQANEARYQLLRALASLERATGGGFCAGLDVPTAPAAPATNGKNNENDMDQNRTER